MEVVSRAVAYAVIGGEDPSARSLPARGCAHRTAVASTAVARATMDGQESIAVYRRSVAQMTAQAMATAASMVCASVHRDGRVMTAVKFRQNAQRRKVAMGMGIA